MAAAKRWNDRESRIEDQLLFSLTGESLSYPVCDRSNPHLLSREQDTGAGVCPYPCDHGALDLEHHGIARATECGDGAPYQSIPLDIRRGVGCSSQEASRFPQCRHGISVQTLVQQHLNAVLSVRDRQAQRPPRAGQRRSPQGGLRELRGRSGVLIRIDHPKESRHRRDLRGVHLDLPTYRPRVAQIIVEFRPVVVLYRLFDGVGHVVMK